MKPVQKDFLERCVIEILREFLSDQGNLASLAVDVSEYARKMHSDDTYLKSLQAELSQTEKEIKNIVDAIKQGLVSKTLQKSLSELETKQEALEDAIETEKAKLALANNDYGIKHYFEMYAKADFEDDDTRRMIFEYFIDKIYVFEDKLIVDMFYSDNHVEVSLDAFLASEEYAKESVKDLKINQGSVFDKNAAGSTYKKTPFGVFFIFYFLSFCFIKLISLYSKIISQETDMILAVGIRMKLIHKCGILKQIL